MAQTLGDRIRNVRETRVLTQEEAAHELGFPARSLQAYEANQATPRQARRRRILDWLAQHEMAAA